MAIKENILYKNNNTIDDKTLTNNTNSIFQNIALTAKRNNTSKDTIGNDNTSSMYKRDVTSSQIINNGDVASNITLIGSGGSLVVSNGGEAYDISICSAGWVDIHGGTISGVTIDNLGSMQVLNGGKSSNTKVNSGGQMSLFSGLASAYNTTIHNGGVVYAYDYSNIENTSINNGEMHIYNNAAASEIAANNSATLHVYLNGKTINTTLTDHAIMTVNNKGSASNTTISDYALLSVQSGGNLYETTINSNGSVTIDADGILQDTLYISNEGSASIWLNAGGKIHLYEDTNTNLTITGLENGGNVTTVISNFNGVEHGKSDAITLKGVNIEDVISVKYKDAQGNNSPDHVTLTLNNKPSITLNIIGAQESGYSLSSSKDGNLVYKVCFSTRMLIRTLSGHNFAIEDLRVGDKILAYDWQNKHQTVKNITWIGYKTIKINPETPYNNIAEYPVRILKNAIATNIPSKDLLVSPEYCLFFDNQFIPVKMLVNNYSIFYDHSITEYTHYHVETDGHSVVWTNGMLTETFLDTGNKKLFKQCENETILQTKEETSAKTWTDDACAPLVTDHFIIKPIFNQILTRAQQVGFKKQKNTSNFSDGPAIHLITEFGETIYPHCTQKDHMVFAIPANTQSVYLESNINYSNDIMDVFVDDIRELGTLIGDITLLTPQQSYKINDHLALNNIQGWHPHESDFYRWTNGHAFLDLYKQQEIKQSNTHNILVVHVVLDGPYLQ